MFSKLIAIPTGIFAGWFFADKVSEKYYEFQEKCEKRRKEQEKKDKLMDDALFNANWGRNLDNGAHEQCKSFYEDFIRCHTTTKRKDRSSCYDLMFDYDRCVARATIKHPQCLKLELEFIDCKNRSEKGQPWAPCEELKWKCFSCKLFPEDFPNEK